MLIDNIEKYLHNILYPSIFSVVGTCTPNNPNGLSTFGLHVFSPVVSAWFRLARRGLEASGAARVVSNLGTRPAPQGNRSRRDLVLKVPKRRRR
jgi:hypothetical protein